MHRFLLNTLFLLVTFTVAAQNTEQEEEIVKKIEIANINAIEENTLSILSAAKKDLKQLSEIIPADITNETDSLYNLITPYTAEYIETLSVQSLKNNTSAIQSITKNVKGIQDSYTAYVEKLQTLNKQIDDELALWTEVKKQLDESKEITSSLKERTIETLKNLRDVKKDLIKLQNIALDNSGKISDYNKELEIIRELMEEQDEELRNSYLVRDSEPLWKIALIEKDTTLQKNKTSAIIAENTEALHLFAKFNSGMLIAHLLIIVVLFLLFRFSQNLTTTILTGSNNKFLDVFSKHPLITAYVYSFLLISFASVSYPVIVVEVFLLSLFAPIYILIKNYIRPENRKYVIIFMVLFSIQLFINHISFVYISGRIFLLVLVGLIFAYFVFIIIKAKTFGSGENYIMFRNSLIISAILFLGAIIANVVGIIKLSLLLSVSTINCIGIGVLIFLYYRISLALIIVLAEIKPFSALHAVKEHKELLIARISGLIKLLLILLYCRAVLRQFKLYKSFTTGWQDFVNRSWEIGEVAITIGDFINFFIIVIITILASRILRYLLKNEFLPLFIRKRGVPNAISTTVYYIVLVTGFFIAAFSTGIEWSKVNLAIGALGVGIGFGLQTLVYNFIAGLILTYERPVQVGDIVQLNTLMGSIKEIGVRSSRVQTYDGAEVVVPNGNLISNEVINWTLSNNHKRQELKFKAATSANPREIVEILKEMPVLNPKVISDPAPLALFEGYSDDGTLNFRLLFWTHVDVGLSSKSEVGLAIYDELQKRGYEIPIQRSTIRIEKEGGVID